MTAKDLKETADKAMEDGEPEFFEESPEVDLHREIAKAAFVFKTPRSYSGRDPSTLAGNSSISLKRGVIRTVVPDGEYNNMEANWVNNPGVDLYKEVPGAGYGVTAYVKFDAIVKGGIVRIVRFKLVDVEAD